MWLPGALILVIAGATALIAFGYLLALFGAGNEEAGAVGQNHPILLPTPVDVLQKHLDRRVFTALVVAAPLFFAGTLMLAVRLRLDLRDRTAIFWSLLAAAMGICLYCGAATQLFGLVVDGHWLATLSCLGLGAVLTAVPPDRAAVVNRWLLAGAWLLAAVIIAAQRIWTVDSAVYYGPFTSHYEAVISAVVRIAGGGTCLADVVPQYGCHGEFIAPLLRLFGSSVLAVTSVYCVLLIIAIGAAMAFARMMFTRPVVLASALLSLVVAVALNLIYDDPDPILQYYPVRFLFPSLSLLLAAWFQGAPSVGRSLVLGIFAGAAIAWNLESGAAVLGSLGLFAAGGPFTAQRWERLSDLVVPACRLAAYTLAAVMFLAAFAAYLYLKSPIAPDWSNYVLFQTLFYVTGFGMLPIPPFPHFWTIYIATIFSTALFAVAWIASGRHERDPRLELAMYVAVLAIGLFLYYSGRSHLLVLRLVAWPGIFLFLFALSRALDDAARGVERRLLVAVTVACVALPSAFLSKVAPAVYHLASSVRAAPANYNSIVRDDIAFIAAHTTVGEPVAIIALNQSVLYGETGLRASLEGPGVAEMIRRADLDRQISALARNGPDKLFVGTNLDRAGKLGLLGTDVVIDFDRIRSAYALAATGPGERLLFFRRKPPAG